MEITTIGWALLILGPALIVVRPAWLFAITMFSLPFTATEIANVGSGLDASGIQVSTFLGSLLLLRHGITKLWRMRLWFPRKGRAPMIWLGSFISVVGLSLAMPIWINGRLQVPSGYLGDPSTTPLLFHSSNLTGFLYLSYGFALAYFIAETVQKPEVLRLTLKSFMSGCVFASLWGLMQLACTISGTTYPAMIFNNGKGRSTLGYSISYLTEGVPRLSSVAVEPSIFAQTLLIALSLYLPFVFGKRALFGKMLDRTFFLLMFVVLLLCSASTAYVGVFILLLLVFALFAIRGALRPRMAALTLAGFCTLALMYAGAPVVRSWLNAILFQKAESGSAIERLMTISNSYEMFLKYPVLGIGWGSVTSHDLIFNILGNAGLLGLFTFVLAMFSVFQSLYRSIKLRRKSLDAATLVQMDFALFVAMGVTLATSAINAFLGVFSFFWFAVGLALAESSVAKPVAANDQEWPSSDPKCDAGARNPAISPRPC